jgi:hypothetical protein
MPIDEEKTCNMHTKEKEKSGTCCRVNEDQENAEQLTYEHNVLVGPAPKETNE